MMIRINESEFILIGFNAYCEVLSDNGFVEYLSIDEWTIENDEIAKGRKLNGDEQKLLFDQPKVLYIKLQIV